MINESPVSYHWKEKKKDEYVSLKVLYEQGKTRNYKPHEPFVSSSFLKTKQGQLHYIEESDWRKQYLTLKVGQTIVWHPQGRPYEQLNSPQVGEIVESQPTDQEIYRVRFVESNPEEITISPVYGNSISTDIFTKHLFDCKSSSSEWTFKEKMDLTIQTFQTARRKEIFSIEDCRWGRRCNDERPGHLMYFSH